jgi:hypothetical protein
MLLDWLKGAPGLPRLQTAPTQPPSLYCVVSGALLKGAVLR